ncbi:MAG: PQQ enzyme repeat-containing protein [Stygiobacter sp.]|nr:MAG: PQQ enzyme repeat-containing protein [Stygiobacter sp.]KAF0215781.1 MAG: PQQ enzyme repeat-containing [Ignavibacteria bacterium]
MKKLFLLLLIGIFAFNSCKKDDSNPVNSSSNEVKIAETAVVANTTTINNLISADSTSLTFSSNATQVQNLKIGSILIIEKGEGYLRKVKSIQQQGGNTKVITENARLEEVITNGEFEKEIILEPENLSKYQFSNNSIKLEKTNGQFSINFNNLVVGVSQGTSVIIDGQTQFASPKIKIKSSFKNGLDSLNASLEINSNTKFVLKVDGALTTGLKITPPWGEFTFAPVTVLVGPVPVLITPKIKLVFGANASINGKVDINFDANTQIIGGIRYKNKVLSPYSSYNQTYNNQNISASAKGSVEGYILLPKLGFYFYSLAGPFVDLKFYGSLRDKSTNTAGLYFGLSGEGGFETDILGFLNFPNAQWKQTLFNYEKEIKSSSYSTNNPPNSPTVNSPSNNSTNITVNSQLSWTCTDPDGDAMNYDVYFGTSSYPSLVSSNQTSTSYDPGNLNNSTKYYWKVIAKDNKGGTTEGSIWNFTTIAGGTAPGAPTLSSPSNNSSNVSISPTLSWNSSNGATSYTLQVSENSSFNNYVYNQIGLTNTSQQVSGLSNSKTYYWRVSASNSFGTSSYSSTWNFTTSSSGSSTLNWEKVGTGSVTYVGSAIKVTGDKNPPDSPGNSFAHLRSQLFSFSGPIIELEFDWTIHNVSNQSAIWLQDSNGKNLVEVTDYASKLGFYTHVTIDWYANIVLNKTYRIVAKINLTTKTADYYVDGTLAKSNIALRLANTSYSSSVRILLCAWKNDSFTIDNITLR